MLRAAAAPLVALLAAGAHASYLEFSGENGQPSCVMRPTELADGRMALNSTCPSVGEVELRAELDALKLQMQEMAFTLATLTPPPSPLPPPPSPPPSPPPPSPPPSPSSPPPTCSGAPTRYHAGNYGPGHTSAVQYCEDITAATPSGFKCLCEYEAICPSGNGQPPVEGTLSNQDQWVPFHDPSAVDVGHRNWVQIGNDVHGVCSTHGDASWGHDDNARHPTMNYIYCCQMEP